MAPVLLTITCLLGTALAAGAAEGERALATVESLPLKGFEPAVQQQLEQAISALSDEHGQPVADATAHGMLGQLLHVYELWVHAAACYRNAIALDPTAADWHHLLGDALQRTGELSDAAHHYRKALALGQNGDPVPVLTRLGETLLELGQLDQAAAELERSVALRPTPAAAAALGRLALARGEHLVAIELLEGVLDVVPGASKLHYQLALAYRGAGRLEQAREHLARRGETGVRIDDPLIDNLERLRHGGVAHSLRGRNAFNRGDFEAAVESFERAVAVRPAHAGGWLNVGAARAQLGRLDGAEQALRRALTLDPSLAGARFNLGSVLRQRGRLGEARAMLDGAVRQAPHDWPARRELIGVLLAIGETDAAAGQVASMLELDPDAEPRLLELVEALTRDGRFRDAMLLLEPAVGTSDRSTHALADLLATCPDRELRDGRRALALALELFQRDRSSGRAQSVAVALAELDRCDEAASWQAQVVAAAEAAGEPGEASLPGLRGWLERYRAGPPCAAPSR